MMLQKQHTRLTVLAILAAAFAAAQSFEVASVKPSQTQTGRFTLAGGPGTSDPTRITYTAVPLRRVLLEAYPVKNYQISGPEWLNTLRFDIRAKVPEGTTKEQFQAMLQDLLRTRFQMTIRRETKEMPLYDLVAAKTGVKIGNVAPQDKPAEDQAAVVRSQEGKDGFPVVELRGPAVVIETRDGRARVTARDVPMSRLADFLAGQLGRPVIDKSGLTGIYSFELYFTPEGANSSDSPEPVIYGALQQQLGLRLEARKGPVELLVVDHAEKTPVEQ